jgi:Sap-like sulfolipid-1-addressing protein
MWSSVLVLALLAGLNPVRLGLILLVISRPRPVQNLLAFWVGALATSFLNLLVPLAVLHATPMLRTLAQDLGKGSTAGQIQIGMGVLALSIAALMILRFSARQRAHLSTPAGNTSTLLPDSNTPAAISRLLERAQDPSTEGGSAIRRLLGRARNAWENGSLWVSLVIGIGIGPAAEEILLLLAIIVASGAATGTQVSAAIAFVIGMLAIVEIMLVSYLATPVKTQAVLRLLHDWARTHRRKILVAMFAVGGISLVASGIASI